MQDRVQNRSTIISFILMALYILPVHPVWWALSFTLSSHCTFLRCASKFLSFSFWAFSYTLSVPTLPLTFFIQKERKRKETAIRKEVNLEINDEVVFFRLLLRMTLCCSGSKKKENTVSLNFWSMNCNSCVYRHHM